MVRIPLSPAQIEVGRRVGDYLRQARGDWPLVGVAKAAGISPETLRKIETGRLPTPSFMTIVALASVLEVPLDELSRICLSGGQLEDAG